MEIGMEKTKGTLSLMGSVIWLADKEIQPHSYPGMGVNFVNLSKATQTKIVEFIDKNITRRSKL